MSKRTKKPGPEKLLIDVRPMENIGWLVSDILEPLDASKPHIGGKLLDMAETDEDSLLRSELISIWGLLSSRFFSCRGAQHKYIPVSI